MTVTEVILICALLAWMGFAFAIVSLLETAVTRTKTRQVRAPRSRARASTQWSTSSFSAGPAAHAQHR